MKKHLLGGAAVVGFLAIPAFAQTPAPAPVPRAHVEGNAQNRGEVVQRVQRMFNRFDADRNGWLTNAEVDEGKSGHRGKALKRGAGRRADHTFEQLDTDRNGSISRAEFDLAHAQHANRAAAHGDLRADRSPRRRGMAGRRIPGGRLFEIGDSDRDGRVSLQEATNAALHRFDMTDANRDGQVTREERRQMRQRLRAERRRG